MSENNDPTGDIYKLMDEAGLTYADFVSTRKSGIQIVNEMRTKLAASLRDYILARDLRSEVKHIEIKSEGEVIE